MKNKKIIAVDFDGTLCENKYPEIGEPRKDVIERLIKEQRAGARVILWTCRSGEELLLAIYWALDKGIAFDAVNANLNETIKHFGNDTRKIYADEYWDDKAVLPYEWQNTVAVEEQPDRIKEFEAEREKAKKLIKKLLLSITAHRDLLNYRIGSLMQSTQTARARGMAQAVEELESLIKFIENFAAQNYGLTASECNNF